MSEPLPLFEEVVQKAWVFGDLDLGEREALVWAEGFQFGDELVRGSEREFQAVGFDFQVLVSQKLRAVSHKRISVNSVLGCIAEENPERDKLILLVEKGMPLFVCDSFAPNGREGSASLSEAYSRVAPAVNRMLMEDFITQGLAFVLSKESCLEHVGPFHLSRLSWTRKSGKAKGRPIIDCSAGRSPLNSDYTKVRCDEEWGEIKHPTIGDIVNMVWQFWDSVRHFAVWEDLVLWKVDLKGAYTLLSFSPDAVRYVAAELSGSLVVFFLSGIFGWTGTPACFQVVTRALVWEFSRIVSGLCVMYVDDVCGVSLRNRVREDIDAVSQLCNRVFQSSCVEATKTVFGRRIDVIGYVIDLDLGRVSITERNFLKSLHGFCTVDLESPVPIKVLQKLASWGSRYSAVCGLLAPFVKTLYSSYAGRTCPFLLVSLDEPTVMVIRVFRALFALAVVQEDRWTRSLGSFRVQVQAQVVVQFDASLTGLGIIWSSMGAGGEYPVGAAAVDCSGWNLQGKPEFQNCMEYLALFIGLLGVQKVVPGSRTALVKGDSVSALAWGIKANCKSKVAFNTAVGVMLTLQCHQMVVVQAEHVPGTKNVLTDALSRGVSNREVDSLPRVQLDVERVLDLCCPHRVYHNEESFVEFWVKLRQAILSFLC